MLTGCHRVITHGTHHPEIDRSPEYIKPGGTVKYISGIQKECVVGIATDFFNHGCPPADSSQARKVPCSLWDGFDTGLGIVGQENSERFGRGAPSAWPTRACPCGRHQTGRVPDQ